MIDITVTSLVKSFEIGNNILDGLSFQVEAGERVGILGPNGCGKTTLFRILTGALDYDEGQVSIAPSKRLGPISQLPVYPEGWTAEDVLQNAFRHVDAVRVRMEKLTEQMEHDSSPALLAEYDRLAADFERLGGYETDVAVNRVANGLQIGPEMRAQSFESLSGGEKTRLNLARLILEDTEILLLDELLQKLRDELAGRGSMWLVERHGDVLDIVRSAAVVVDQRDARAALQQRPILHLTGTVRVHDDQQRLAVGVQDRLLRRIERVFVLRDRVQAFQKRPCGSLFFINDDAAVLAHRAGDACDAHGSADGVEVRHAVAHDVHV